MLVAVTSLIPSDPVALAIMTALLIVVVLVIHAYFDTRKKSLVEQPGKPLTANPKEYWNPPFHPHLADCGRRIESAVYGSANKPPDVVTPKIIALAAAGKREIPVNHYELCEGQRDPDPGEDLKFLTVTMSETLRQGSKLELPLEWLNGTLVKRTIAGQIVEGFFDWGRFEQSSNEKPGVTVADLWVTLHVQLTDMSAVPISLTDCSLSVVFQNKTFNAAHERIILPQSYCIERPVRYHTSHEGISRKANESIPSLDFPITLAPTIPVVGLLQFVYPEREKTNDDYFQDTGVFTLTFTDSLGHRHEIRREVSEWAKTGTLIVKPPDA